MVKRVILISKRPEMTGEQFRKYYIETHGPIVARMPGLLRYFQNPTLPGADGQEQEISGIAEVWYESEEAMHAALMSPEGAAAAESLAKFADPAKTQMIPVEEYEILGSPGEKKEQKMSDSKKTCVAITLQAHPGQEAAVEALFQEFIPIVNKEPGVIRYELQRSCTVPGRYLLYELYDDYAALQEHRGSELFQVWRPRIAALEESRQMEEFDTIL